MKANPAASDASKGGRTLLKDKAYLALKQQILSDRYPPGSALAERRLAQELGMSKTPVKAALERLELEGYIVIAPQQYVRVRELDASEIVEQFEMRTALETYIVRQLAEHISDDLRERIKASLARQRELLESNETEQRVNADSAFHLLLAEVLGNQSIMRTMSDLQDRMYRVLMRVFTKTPNRYNECVEEHARIADALLAGDREQAAQHVISHLKQGQTLCMG